MRFARALALLAGLLALGYGLTLPAVGSQGRWLACLGAAGILLGFALWPRSTDADSPAARPVVNVAAVIGVFFGLIAVQLLRMHVLASGSITRRRGADPATGDVISNPREVNAGLEVHRGRIVDRRGVVLAETVDDGDVVTRRYPVADASYVAGYFSPLKFGTAGLEDAFDDELSGRETGNPLRAELDRLLGRSPRGADLRLTLDVPLQELAHQLIGDRTGSAVLLEARTGAVRVLASNPHHDPAALVAVDAATAGAAQAAWDALNEDPARPLLTRSTSGLYTPGSTFKTITASAAIETGIATPDTVYEDDGTFEVDGRVIVEENRPDDTVDQWTLRQGLAFSLNVVFAQVGLQVGAGKLAEYAGRFGFGHAAPFDLPVAEGQVASSPGFLDNPAALADTAFGQGELLTTPLNMALVAAAFANGGAVPRPYLVDRVIGPDGRAIRSADTGTWTRPISRETADTVAGMMRYVVSDGYATAAQIPDADVGGKTGTAETGDGEPHAWFIGFGGASGPDFAFAVVLEHGGVATREPIAIARELLAAAIRAG